MYNGSKACVHAKSLQLCPTLCDIVDYSPPGFSVHGILQTRILEWPTIASSWGSSRPRDQTCVSYVSCTGRWALYHQHHLRSCICRTVSDTSLRQVTLFALVDHFVSRNRVSRHLGENGLNRLSLDLHLCIFSLRNKIGNFL